MRAAAAAALGAIGDEAALPVLERRLGGESSERALAAPHDDRVAREVRNRRRPRPSRPSATGFSWARSSSSRARASKSFTTCFVNRRSGASRRCPARSSWPMARRAPECRS
ncbi:MAG: hypothetical protein IPG50_29905 [Myxococcales bacterium]|nr:hypothetical protein [Myxococcales bacterium]